MRVPAARAGEMCRVYRPASRSAVLAACTRAAISTCAGTSRGSNRLPVIASISSSVSVTSLSPVISSGEVRVPACVPLGRQRQDASRVPGRVAQADPGVDHVEQRHEGRGPEAVGEPAVVVLPDRGASRVGAEPDQRARRRGHLAADRLRQRHLGIQPQVQAQRRAALRGDLRDRRAQALAHRRLVFRLGGVVGGQVAVQRLQLLQQARRLRDLMRPGGAQLPR